MFYLTRMRVAGVCIRAAVEGAAGARVRLRVAPTRQYERNGGDDADHKNDASDANADSKVALRYADLVFFL